MGLEDFSKDSGAETTGQAVQYSTVQYNTVQYSNRRGGWCQGWITPYSTLCGVSVAGAASLVAECGTNILFKKC